MLIEPIRSLIMCGHGLTHLLIRVAEMGSIQGYLEGVVTKST